MLVNLADVKNRLGITGTDDDQFLTDQINFISEVIENYCGRKFIQASYTETFYADEILQSDIPVKKIYSFHYPVVSVASFQINGEDVSYRLRKSSGRFFRLQDSKITDIFNSESDVLEISYDAGYADTPTIVKEVCFSLVEERYNKQKSGVGLNFGSDVQSIAIPGTMSIQFDFTLQSNERVRKFGQVLGNYANMLDSFRSERVVLGKIMESEID